MSGSQPPKVQVGDPIALALDCDPDLLGNAGVGRSVEQNGAGIAYQSNRPARDHERADEAGQRIHPEPAERACQN